MRYADCAADDVMGQTTGHLYYLSTESYSPSASLRFGLIKQKNLVILLLGLQ